MQIVKRSMALEYQRRDKCFRLASVAAGVLLAMGGPAFAADAPSAPADAKAEQLGRVDVVGSNMDDRRNAPAAKLSISREELARYGDTTIAEALQRVPGVTVSRTASKDLEIRLRGLGNGYTQILINGDPVAPGFSIESLSPDLVDRIELYRSSTSDSSSQAIAGTLNILLKQAGQRATRAVKFGTGAYGGAPSSNAGINISDKSGALSYGLDAAGGVTRDRWQSSGRTVATRAANVALYDWKEARDQRSRQVSASLAPQLVWKLSDGDSLSASWLVQAQRVRFGMLETRETLSGQEPDFASNSVHTRVDTDMQRLTLEWKTRLGEVGRFTGKLLGSSERRNADTLLDGYDDAGGVELTRAVHSVTDGRSFVLVGKYSLDLDDFHTLGVGWDGQMDRRSESRIQRETSQTGHNTEDLDEGYIAHVDRLAVYAQVEWQATPRLSVYAGGRGETLRTRTNGSNLATVNVRSSVLSPSLQILWKLPDSKSDQIRLAVSRTYRPPTARELVPRRWVQAQNSAATPNFQGNPDLKPELAWGFDLAYEHYLESKGFIGANVYGRRIDHVVLNRVYKFQNVWIATPQNQGSASLLGLELEVKGKLRSLWAEAPDVSLRSGLTRNWSRLDAVPGPGNRLARQPRATGVLGADWRPSTSKWTFGGSWTFESPGYSKTTVTDSIEVSNKHILDVYALWDFSKVTRVRFTASNLLPPDDRQTSSHFDGYGTEAQYLRSRRFTAAKLLLETQF